MCQKKYIIQHLRVTSKGMHRHEKASQVYQSCSGKCSARMKSYKAHSALCIHLLTLNKKIYLRKCNFFHTAYCTMLYTGYTIFCSHTINTSISNNSVVVDELIMRANDLQSCIQRLPSNLKKLKSVVKRHKIVACFFIFFIIFFMHGLAAKHTYYRTVQL